MAGGYRCRHERGRKHLPEPRDATGGPHGFGISTGLSWGADEPMGACGHLHAGNLDDQRSRVTQPGGPNFCASGHIERLHLYCDRRALFIGRPNLLAALAWHYCDHARRHSGGRDTIADRKTTAGEPAMMKWVLVAIIAGA